MDHSGERDPEAALRNPSDWPRAAAQLVARGDRAALPALVAAYELRTEASRRPLLEAMDALGGVAAASELARSDDATERRLAARLAHLLPDPSHVEGLERLVADADAGVARQARAALRTQVRDPAWRAAVARLAASADPELRAAAEAWTREG